MLTATDIFHSRDSNNVSQGVPSAPMKSGVIASVGLDSVTTLFVKSLVKLYCEHHDVAWHYRENIDATLAGMELGTSDGVDMLLLDVDSDAGRRAWYTIRALHTDGWLVVLTEAPDTIQADHVLSKPLIAKRVIDMLKSAISD